MEDLETNDIGEFIISLSGRLFFCQFLYYIKTGNCFNPATGYREIKNTYTID
jgi:hypothetical protein